MGRMRWPGGPETLVNQPLQGRRAAPPAPEVSSSSRRKRAGFAAHGEIIADGPGKGKGRAVQTGALNVQKITAGVLKPPLRASITAIGAGRTVTRRYSGRSEASDAEPWAREIGPEQFFKSTKPAKNCRIARKSRGSGLPAPSSAAFFNSSCFGFSF